MTDLDLLQPAPPRRYHAPTVVEPHVQWSDAWRALRADTPQRLRAALCAAYGAKHCLLLDRARTGLALLVEGMKLRGEWITTSFMHRPTAVLLACKTAGLRLADIDDHFTMDPASAEAAAAPGTVGLLATHMFGKVAAIDRLRELADRRGLFLVENCVHLPPFLEVAGKRAGGFGDATLLSFNVDKPLGGLLGGALLTNRDDVWERVTHLPLAAPDLQELRDRVQTALLAYRLKPLLLQVPWLGDRFRRASNLREEIVSFDVERYRHYIPRRIHPLQAAIALGSLQEEPERTRRRVANALSFSATFGESDAVTLPVDNPQMPHSFVYFPVILRRHSRFELAQRLAAAGIETKWRYYPLHLQPDLRAVTSTALDNTDRLWRQHLLLPINARMSEVDIAALADRFRSTLLS